FSVHPWCPYLDCVGHLAGCRWPKGNNKQEFQKILAPGIVIRQGVAVSVPQIALQVAQPQAAHDFWIGAHAILRPLAKAIQRDLTQLRTSGDGVIGVGEAPQAGYSPNFDLYWCEAQPGL